MSRKRSVLLFGGAVYAVLLWWAVNRYLTDRAQHVAAEVAETPLNDSTVAKLTATRLERDSLRVLLKAAQQLDGSLLVALRLHVPQRDTVWVHDTIETVRYVDGTRVGRFQDSVSWAKVSAKVTAPPFPAALIVDSLTVTRPPFNPAVGLVRTGRAYFAVVSWQDEKVQVEVPFANVPPKQPWAFPYVRVAYSPNLVEPLVRGAFSGSAGLGFRIGSHLEPYTEISSFEWNQRLTTPRIWFGLTYRF